MGEVTFTIRFEDGTTASQTATIIVPKIMDGFWSDPINGGTLKELTYGEKVKLTLKTRDIPNGTKLNLTLFDFDGNYNPDDELDRTFSAIVKNDIAELEFTPDYKWEESAKYETDRVVEVYFKVEADVEVLGKPKLFSSQFPKKKEEYLKIYPQEIKITVIVELPHSSETGWGAKGLAGHTAMAIGERYFDYGPDYNTKTIKSLNEKKYDYDFNEDGDKNDIVDLTGQVNHKFAPGKPWWGDHIADKKGLKPSDITLSMALKYIQLHWQGVEQPTGSRNFPHATYIYGEVHKIEFFVDESQAEKMIDWWENRYYHPKAYSIFPWTGEQCTTTVKSALQSGNINIPDMTQKPVGILHDFQSIILSTSIRQKGKKPNISMIKPESVDFKP